MGGSARPEKRGGRSEDVLVAVPTFRSRNKSLLSRWFVVLLFCWCLRLDETGRGA